MREPQSTVVGTGDSREQVLALAAGLTKVSPDVDVRCQGWTCTAMLLAQHSQQGPWLLASLQESATQGDSG